MAVLAGKRVERDCAGGPSLYGGVGYASAVRLSVGSGRLYACGGTFDPWIQQRKRSKEQTQKNPRHESQERQVFQHPSASQVPSTSFRCIWLSMRDMTEGESRRTILVSYYGASTGSIDQVDGIRAGRVVL